MTPRAVLALHDRAAVDEFVPKVRAAVGDSVVTLKLFGSRASGRDTGESDIASWYSCAKPIPESRIACSISPSVPTTHQVYISPRGFAESVLHDPVWTCTRFVQTLVHEAVLL